jgi:glycosyltransferase involved in cell wall biosynthesis
MRLIGVTMVKDEADVIRHTIENLFRQGVDEVIAMDNLSTDDTHEILMDMTNEYPMFVDIDHEVGYYQSRKMTALAQTAFNRGADVVVPFDADEYWTGRGRSLRESIESTEADIFHFRLTNYFPTHDDVVSVSPFETIVNRDVEYAPLNKVAVRNVPGLVIEQGNHNARGNGAHKVVGGALIGHFPWRSPKQFESKVRNGAAAYKATDLPDEMGGHWRSYGEILEHHGSEALRSHFYEWFHTPELETVRAPVTKEWE